MAWVHLSADAFTESGPIAGLAVAANDNDIGYSTIGARAAVTLPVAGMLVTPRGSLAWQYAFGDTVPGLALAFATTNLGFGVAGVPLAQNSALIEAGADVLLWADAKLGLSYVGQFADRLQDNGLQGRLDVRF